MKLTTTMINHPFNEKDVMVIRWQLGREHINIAGIVERCEYGYPRIMLLNPDPGRESRGQVPAERGQAPAERGQAPAERGQAPAERGQESKFEALSNVMWLTCPYLNEKIHELENKGFIEKIAAFIRGDAALAAMMMSAHAQFYFLRKSLHALCCSGTEPMEDFKTFNAGIGGTRDISTIKCLHAHFCHYRVCGDNLAGRITSALLDHKINCDEVRCRHAGKKQ